MNILFIGDIVGKIGREAVLEKIEHFINKYDIDFVIANGENVTHGKGLIYSHYKLLEEAGIDVFTLGNHYDSKSQLRTFIDDVDNIVRPANLISGTFPGYGSNIFYLNGFSIRVTNLLGQSFMSSVNTTNHYLALKNILEEEEYADIHIVDFHGESTSEKQIMANVFDGQVSAILGTHTHVQTRDARVLKNGTAFISDVGMCGSFEGVIGWDVDSVVNRFIYGSSKRIEVAENTSKMFNAVVLKIDEFTGKCNEIFTIYHVWED